MLSCPIFDDKKNSIAVIEFLRLEAPFNDNDKYFAEEIVKALSLISQNQYLQMLNKDKERTRSSNQDCIDKKFRIDTFRFFDCFSLIENLKISLRRIVFFDCFDCAVIDQDKEEF